MNDDTDTTAVLDAVRGAVGPVAMHTPVEQIVAAGHRRRRARRTAIASGAVAVTGLALVATTQTAPAATASVHVHTAAYAVDSGTDGTVRVSWDKQRYFEDHAGLEAALRQAGIPVLVKVGEFCRGPQDDPAVTGSGIGPGVDRVMHGERLDGHRNDRGSGDKPADPRTGEAKTDGPKTDDRADRAGADEVKAGQQGGGDPAAADQGAAERVALVFTPSAMPPGMQLFIGYLSPAQLAATGGNPGSVERLVPIDGPLTCTTDLPE